MTDEHSNVKARDAAGGGWRQYRRLTYGDTCPLYALRAEITFALFGAWPGAVGLGLRRLFYRGLLGACGPGLVVGRNVTFRHPKKIRLGRNVVIDDDCVVDAKGDTNEGIVIGDNVFIGRRSTVYCKNGNIRLGDRVNISSNCTLFSSNSLTVAQGTLIGGYSYLLSGGEYDLDDARPFAEQDGMVTRGELTVGANVWIGARVTVLDAACIGDGCVIGAGALVNKPVPAGNLAVGVPARVIRTIASANSRRE